MVARRDLENGSTSDERAPLLAPSRSENVGAAPTEEEELAAKPQSEASKRREYGWRGFWIVVAILIVALFVKGWIESDDVDSNGYLAGLPSPIKTIFASLCAAAFRMILTPIDTLKTTLQAEGSRGTTLLRQRIKTNGIGSLWWGAFATAAATFVGHYPWFATYNFLSETITEPPRSNIVPWLLRAAFIGFCASVVSDTISNSLRVVKTYRQVHDTQISYTEAARRVIRQDGRRGLFGRGLKTRIIANGLQGILFSILWKLFLKIWEDKTGDGKHAR
ncbi:hypothetical protein N0V95_001821 [Ascochyta clinopodiicola]|nr:hypothetical protein N0V95_001821 [Ascochyta clinopodiicola]